MDKKYKKFISELIERLIEQTDLEADKVYFIKKGTWLTPDGDRLFVDIASDGTEKESYAFYVEKQYEDYLAGNDLQNLVHMIINEYLLAKENTAFAKTKNLDHYDKVKDDLFIRLINADTNAEELKDAVFHTLGDIAFVLYFSIDWDRHISMKVRRNHFDKWKMDAQQVLNAALHNMARIAPPRMYLWNKWLDDDKYTGERILGDLSDEEKNVIKNNSGNCVSTVRRCNGATAIFYPGVLESLGVLLGNFYVIFSSSNEVMICGEDMHPFNVIHTVVDVMLKGTAREQDFVTEKIGIYDASQRNFKLLDDENA